MPKCKQCEAKYGIWSDCGDGLCKPCHEKAVAEAPRKETERKRQVLADAETTIDYVVRVIAGDEKPVCVVFLNDNVQQKSSGLLKKLPGMISGLAVGGVMGEMIFGGSLLSNKATYAGELCILVVTATRLLIGYCADTPFFSQSAEIYPEHLQLLQAQCNANTIGRVVCAISSSQVSATDKKLTIVNGGESVSFNRSELYVNNQVYQTPSLQEVSKQVTQLGMRATPHDFTVKLLSGENPLQECQVDESVRDAAYMAALMQAIFTHKQRDTLIEKLPILAPSIRTAIEQQLCDGAQSFQSNSVKLVVWGLLAIIAVVGIILTGERFISLLLVGIIITAIKSIIYFVRLNRAAWCRTIMKRSLK